MIVILFLGTFLCNQCFLIIIYPSTAVEIMLSFISSSIKLKVLFIDYKCISQLLIGTRIN